MSVRSQKLLSKIRSMRSTLSMRGGPGSGRHPGSAMSEEEYNQHKDNPNPVLKAYMQEHRPKQSDEGVKPVPSSWDVNYHPSKEELANAPKMLGIGQNRPELMIAKELPHPGPFKRPAFTPKMKVSKKVSA